MIGNMTITKRLLLSLIVALFAATGFAQEEETTAPVADVPTLLSEASFYLERGECSLTQYVYQEVLREDPQNEEALVGRGRALACQGGLPLAIESYQQALSINSQNLDALIYLANAYQQQYQGDPASYGSRLADGLDAIQRAEDISRNDARVQNSKGLILFQLNNLSEAQSALEFAVRLAAEDQATLSANEKSTIQVNLGRVYRGLGEYELARGAFRRGVIYNPASSTAHSHLGQVEVLLGSCEAAEYELAQAVSLNPNSLSTRAQFGIGLFECGNEEASIAEFERAVEMDGAIFVPQVYTYLARAYLAVGRVDDAIRRAEHGALLPPESADAFYWLGRSYQQRGDSSDSGSAREAYQRALEIDSSHFDARDALNQL